MLLELELWINQGGFLCSFKRGTQALESHLLSDGFIRIMFKNEEDKKKGRKKVKTVGIYS